MLTPEAFILYAYIPELIDGEADEIFLSCNADKPSRLHDKTGSMKYEALLLKM